MTKEGPVLVTWISVMNDPFERGKDDKQTLGPTLTVLFDEDSPFKGKIGDVYLLHRETGGGKEACAVKETLAELNTRQSTLKVHQDVWRGDDPTDHYAIFRFLREAVPRIRQKFAGRELLIHISPGTPSMQTVWVLMAEVGFVDPPFQLVKSYRKADRRGGPAVVPVNLEIETFYKVYKNAVRPRQGAPEDKSVLWDPGQLQTATMKNLFVEARRRHLVSRWPSAKMPTRKR